MTTGMINLATHGYLPTNVLNNATWEFLDIGHLSYLWMPYFDGPFPITMMMAQAVSSQQGLLGHHKGMDLKRMNKKTTKIISFPTLTCSTYHSSSVRI